MAHIVPRSIGDYLVHQEEIGAETTQTLHINPSIEKRNLVKLAGFLDGPADQFVFSSREGDSMGGRTDGRVY